MDSNRFNEILIKNSIAFAGIDMIGNHLTEINVTSPTGAKEIFDQSGVNRRNSNCLLPDKPTRNKDIAK